MNTVNNTSSQSQSQTSSGQSVQMTDRDYLNDILATEKYLTDGMNIATREVSHDALFQTVRSALNETHDLAREVYNLMYAKGWYKLESAEAQKISQTATQFQGYLSQFPNPSGTQQLH